MLRLKHTDQTTRCHHSKSRLTVEGQCRCYFRVGDRKKARLVQCSNNAVLRAHMHTEDRSTFVLVNACSTCNNNKKSTMYVKPRDCNQFDCPCKYRVDQTPHHGTHRR